MMMSGKDFLKSHVLSWRRYVMLWCHAIVDDVGDHLMSEQSVVCNPDHLLSTGVRLTLFSQHEDKLSRNFSL